jgi:ATP-dependent RNA helicase RhlE
MGPDLGRLPAHGAVTPKERPDIIRRTSAGRSRAGFDRFDLHPQLIRAIADASFTAPRPIQERALSPALGGRDVLGLAQTGTGKTAAFVLPILQRLLAVRRPGPRALVVAPTRELAAQVHAEFERLARYTQLSCIAIFGGVPITRQVRGLRRHPDVIVACPGRLLDLLSQRALCLDGVEVLVLDEADHMFDLGFLPDVRRILRALPPCRQNLLFSATMPSEIRKLADTVLKKPAVIELAHSRPADTIAHALYPLTEGDKIGALERLIAGENFHSAIVFLRTKRRARSLAKRLDEHGHAAIALQGDMSQPQRQRALEGFRDARYDVLVATDIAARGLDITGVSHVVNFDMPNTSDAYTHRIGRTGRSGQTGTAFTFVTPDDTDAVRALEHRLGAVIERRRLAELGPIEQATLKGARGQRRRPLSTVRSPKPTRSRWARTRSAVQADPARPACAARTATSPGVIDGLGSERSRKRQERSEAPRHSRRRIRSSRSTRCQW